MHFDKLYFQLILFLSDVTLSQVNKHMYIGLNFIHIEFIISMTFLYKHNKRV